MMYRNEDFIYDSETGGLIHSRVKSDKTRAYSPCPIVPSSTTGYLYVRQDGKAYGQHRVAWLLVHGYWPYEIDHVNGIKMDNRLCNLRAVSSSENSRNKPRQSNNLSGITGVRFCTKRKRWVSQIKFQGRVEFLGRYRDLFNAVCARKSAEVKYGFHENHGRTKA